MTSIIAAPTETERLFVVEARYESPTSTLRAPPTDSSSLPPTVRAAPAVACTVSFAPMAIFWSFRTVSSMRWPTCTVWFTPTKRV